MSTNKEHGISIGVNQLITYATLLPILWFVAQPLLIDALAEDVKDIVATQAEPLQDAFAVLLLRDINSLRKEIAALKHRQRNDDTWDADDAEDLINLEIEIEALREATAKLKQGE
jgi:hypothetical protein